MSVLTSLLHDVTLPKMVRVRQIFPEDGLRDIEGALRAEFQKPLISQRIRQGARIAVGVGSRGLADLPVLVSVIVDELKKRGASPFIVPAMGSHGGATAEGQVSLLAALGVSEASAGCRIVSSMETVQLGAMENGLPVLMDRNAMEADGIVIINRVKPHTSFSGPIESGLVKMITIGLGKQKGADACHSLGFGLMAKNIVAMAKVSLAKAPILFGVASVENSYDRISRVTVIPAEEIIAAEEKLLLEAKSKMPRILFTPIDVLIVDRMGKEFSGTGTDPHITGRAATPFVETRQRVSKMAILDLSEKSHGNAAGIGLADVCTRRLFDKIDFAATYANHITSTVLAGAKIPVIMDSDRLAIQVAIKTCNVPAADRLRIVRIPNTLHLETILISEPLLEEARNNPLISILEDAEDWHFDREGWLNDLDDHRAAHASHG